MQKVLVTDLRGIYERRLVLKIVFSQPISVGFLVHRGKYNIVQKQSQMSLQRNFVLVLTKEGVNVSLILRNTPHRLLHKDIVACEKEMLRLVQSRLAIHHQARIYKSIRGSLVGQLSALVSQDTRRVNKERAQSHGLGQPPVYSYDTSLGLVRDILSKRGNTCLLPV